MTIREYAADCVRQARSSPMIEGEIFYIQAFKEAFPNWAWRV